MQRNLTRENCTQAFLNSRKRAEEQAAADEQAAAEAAEFEEAELIAMAIADTPLRRHDDLTTRKSSEARDSAESTALVATTSTASAVEQLERACSIALTRSEGGRNEQQVGSAPAAHRRPSTTAKPAWRAHSPQSRARALPSGQAVQRPTSSRRARRAAGGGEKKGVFERLSSPSRLPRQVYIV